MRSSKPPARVRALVRLLAFILILGPGWPINVSAQQSAVPGEDDKSFAVVNGTPLPVTQLVAALRREMRQRFYHGRIPAGQAELLLAEVTQAEVLDHLLVVEARRRGLRPDQAAIDARVAEIDRINADREGWAEAREQVLAAVREQEAGQQLRAELERQVREVDAPSEATVRAYYDANPDKFTQPERLRASVILLQVDPSAGGAAWADAQARAKALHARLQQGADFAELAREFSDDPTADAGGDMGYLHAGMLGSEAQQQVDQLEPGEFSEPLQLLEGFALFRLDERQPAALQPYDAVAARARALWLEETAERAWDEFKTSLQARAQITVDDEVLADLREQLKALSGS